MIHNVVGISGGKDSTALGLLAIEKQTENLKFVFADTGHEHSETYEYVEYLDSEFKARCGVGITTVRADFADRIEAKRQRIAVEWPEAGISQDRVDAALAVMKPTGNAFLDMCLWKGVFPSTRRRWCTEVLKHKPMEDQVQNPILESGCQALINWQGVRADESKARAHLKMHDVEFGQWEPEPQGHLIYRPIIKWNVKDVFAMHRKHGLKPNPLYKKGMYRVGCMPCIHSRKAELRAIAKNYPEVFEHLAFMERTVNLVCKNNATTFFHTEKTPGVGESRSHAMAVKEWATGGSQLDLVEMFEGAPSCSSVYGLCE